MLLIADSKGVRSKQVGKSGKSPFGETGLTLPFRGGPLDGQCGVFFRFALYLDATGTPLRPRDSKIAAYIGVGGNIDGIYCLGDDEYVWTPAHRDGQFAKGLPPPRRLKQDGINADPNEDRRS